MRKLFLFLMAVLACTWSSSAYARVIKGYVLDAANDEPLIGATIMPVGGGQGTSAGLDGDFELKVPDAVKKLTVSYVGYEPQTVAVSDNMRIRLKSTATALDNVVVVAYGTATKESLTGSVAQVGSKEIEDRPVTSVTAALEGNAPGVQVNNTYGSPGSSPSIIIRGFNTINGTTSPLYVVDGIPYEGTIADLNPADVESMTVLKDAASAALYGAKGANGVILIQTKKAKKAGKVDVTLQIQQGTYSRGLPRYETMKANEWMNTAFQAYANGNYYIKNGYYTPGADLDSYVQDARESFITSFAKYNVYGDASTNTTLFDENGRLQAGLNPLSGYTDLDWWDSVKRTGYRQEYNINAAGATDKFNIFASVGYMKEQGYMIKSDFERYSARLNANYNPTSYFRFGVNLMAAYQNQNYSSNVNDSSTEDPFNVLGVAPIFPYYEHDPETGAILYDNGNPVWNEGSYLQGSNPGYTLRLNNDKLDALLADANVYGTAILPYGFEATVRGSIHRDKTGQTQYTNSIWGSGAGADAHGLFLDYSSTFGTHTFMQQLNWNHDYGMHHIDVLLDHENYKYWSNNSYVSMHNEIFPNILNIKNFSDYSYATGGVTEIRTESYLGRARYNYDQKYFGEFSLRRDGSSRFSKNNRWGTFWSIGASWIISKENFMQSLPWVDYLKLRASYGSVGNDASAGAYAYWSLYAIGNPINGSPTLNLAQIALNDVKWESTKTLDVGLDGTLFNNRLNFSIGYYNKRNADLLMYVRMPGSMGSTSAGAIMDGSIITVLDNIGTMENHGFELSFNGDIVRNADWLWSASIDATFNKNKVVKLPDGSDIISGSRIIHEGKSLYEWYLYEWAGIDMKDGAPLLAIDRNAYEVIRQGDETAQEAFYNGLINDAKADGSYREIDGKSYTTVSSHATKNFQGTSLPTVYGSFGTSATWKGISLGVLFTYSLGGKVLDSNYASYMSIGSSPAAIHKDITGAWVPSQATEQSVINPSGIPWLNNAQMENGSGSTRFLTSADYLVFKNLNITYSFPAKLINPLQLQGLSIGMAIDNLFTVTARKGMNPQQSWSGSQTESFVTARVFSFNLTARF